MKNVLKTQVIRKLKKLRKLSDLTPTKFRNFRIWGTPRARGTWASAEVDDSLPTDDGRYRGPRGQPRLSAGFSRWPVRFSGGRQTCSVGPWANGHRQGVLDYVPAAPFALAALLDVWRRHVRGEGTTGTVRRSVATWANWRRLGRTWCPSRPRGGASACRTIHCSKTGGGRPVVGRSSSTSWACSSSRWNRQTRIVE